MNELEIVQTIINEINERNLSPRELIIFTNTSLRRKHLLRKNRAEVKKACIDKLSTLSTSYEKWQECFTYVTFNSNETAIQHILAKKLVMTAKTFSHWRGVLAKRVICAKYAEKAIAMMLELANSPEELLIVYSKANYGSQYQLQAIEKLLGINYDFDEWLKACKKSPMDSNLRKQICKLSGNIEMNLEQIKKACDHLQSEISDAILKKLSQFKGTLADWCKIYIEFPEGPVKQMAFEKMRENME